MTPERLHLYRQIIELRRLGMPVPDITLALNFTTDKETMRFLRAALKCFCSESAEEIRAQELDRLADLESILFDEARKGALDKDCIAFDRVLKVIAMRLEWSGARPAPTPPAVVDNRLQVLIQTFSQPPAIEAGQAQAALSPAAGTQGQGEAFVQPGATSSEVLSEGGDDAKAQDNA